MLSKFYAKNHFVPIFLASSCGAIFAFFLLWFMFVLIQSGDRGLEERSRIHIADFIQAKTNEKTRLKERPPERPKTEKEPPAPDMATDADALDSDVIQISAGAIDVVLDADDGFFFGSGDGEFLPIVKVAPIYPMQASNKDIEGYCLVEYTVTTAGTVKDVRVIEEECTHRYFHKPSIKAAYKFRYKPRVIAGSAIEVKGVRNRFFYELTDPIDEE